MIPELSLIAGMIAIASPVLASSASAMSKREKDKLKLSLSGQVIALAASLAGLINYLSIKSSAHSESIIGQFLQFDSTALILMVAIFFIGSVVTAFSQRYLVAWQKRVDFIQGITMLAVISAVMAASNSLLISLAAWTAISFSLWHLIKMSPQGSISAAKVLRYHILSDLLFAIAVIWLCFGYGCFELGNLTALAPRTLLASDILGLNLSVSNLDILSFILVLSFIVKSALFPFHGWLLATLDAPTPLSGLLHAGVVNIAAVAAARFFPVLQESPSALFTLGLFGGLSALVGTQIMSVQSDVKRKLVYSTVGQMGFMCLQCATGLIPLAIFHLIAHGLFKCHLFLISGSAVEEGKVRALWGIEHKESNKLNSYVISLIVLVPAGLLLFQNPEANLVTIVFIATLAVLLIQLPSVARINLTLLLGATAMAALFALLSHNCMHFFERSIEVGNWQMNSFLLSVGILFTAHAGLTLIRKTELGSALYVLCLQRFYLEELLSRVALGRTQKEKPQFASVSKSV